MSGSGLEHEGISPQRLAAPQIRRRLAAIAFADVVGFSRLVESDDVGTMLNWKALRDDLLSPKTAEHRGRRLRLNGDGIFVEFQSVVDAVTWAQDVKRGLAYATHPSSGERLQLRFGINVEDVIVDDVDMDLHGDGVNIAARIHDLAEPGDILITAAVREFVWNKLALTLEDLGEHKLKNISRPIRVYRLQDIATSRPGPHVNWSNRRSIAVLPLRNLSGDPQEEYFAEGIVEDIVAGLARSRSLYVIARQSTLHFRDRQDDVRRIGSELGVRYIVGGSVRRQGTRLRIACELTDVEQNRTIWAHRFDGKTEEIFEFQDQIASAVAGAIEPQVLGAESVRARVKPTESLDAYDSVLRALSMLSTLEGEELDGAGTFLNRAIELDPAYAQAHAYKAWWLVLMIGEGRSVDRTRDGADAEIAAQRAMQLDPADAFVLAVAGHVEAFVSRRPENAMDLLERSLHLNDNSAFAWGMSAVTCCYLGRPDEALDRLRNAWRLNPLDPLSYFFWNIAGLAEIVAQRYAEAVGWQLKSERANPRFVPCLRQLAAALALSGKTEEARNVAVRLLAREPQFTVSKFVAWYPLRDAGALQRYAEGLRAAGLPD